MIKLTLKTENSELLTQLRAQPVLTHEKIRAIPDGIEISTTRTMGQLFQILEILGIHFGDCEVYAR